MEAAGQVDLGYYQRAVTSAIESASSAQEAVADAVERSHAALQNDPAYPWDEKGAAARFWAIHGRDLLYHTMAARWYCWDGRHFAAETAAQGGVAGVDLRAQTFQDDLRALPATCSDPEVAEEAQKYVARMRTRRAHAAIVSYTEAQCAVREEELDADPLTLAAPNGMVRLSTGEMEAHDRRFRATMMCSVPYDGSATSTLWQRFLDRVLPCQETREFFQKCVGYSLLGVQEQQVFFFVHGPGSTGKSTAMKAISQAIGTYHRAADFQTFLASRNGRSAGGPSSDLARLARARFVSSVEVGHGEALDTGRIKQISGGDTMVARGLHASEQEFTPALALWLVANDRPHARLEDDALWRRLVPFHFSQHVAREDADTTLGARLSGPEAQSSVLAWAVAGAVRYAEEGHLDMPEEVAAGVTDYQAEVDPLADFISECVLDLEGSEISSKALRDAYLRWLKDADERAQVGRNRFHSIMAQKFQHRGDRSTRRTYMGIALLHDPHG
jgi:putative DNA primase/helicase